MRGIQGGAASFLFGSSVLQGSQIELRGRIEGVVELRTTKTRGAIQLARPEGYWNSAATHCCSAWREGMVVVRDVLHPHQLPPPSSWFCNP